MGNCWFLKKRLCCIELVFFYENQFFLKKSRAAFILRSVSLTPQVRVLNKIALHNGITLRFINL
jgi:hypothetical protein